LLRKKLFAWKSLIAVLFILQLARVLLYKNPSETEALFIYLFIIIIIKQENDYSDVRQQ